MNAPFSIGQKVVCVDAKTPSPHGYVPTELQNGKIYIINGKKICSVIRQWCYEVGTGTMHYHWRFAPIQSNYADATAEIIEKFKPTEDTQEKIIIPEKLKSIP